MMVLDASKHKTTRKKAGIALRELTSLLGTGHLDDKRRLFDCKVIQSTFCEGTMLEGEKAPRRFECSVDGGMSSTDVPSLLRRSHNRQ